MKQDARHADQRIVFGKANARRGAGGLPLATTRFTGNGQHGGGAVLRCAAPSFRSSGGSPSHSDRDGGASTRALSGAGCRRGCQGVLHLVYGWEHHAYSVRTPDHGSTFTAQACSMCMMRARAGTNGSVYPAFRSAENSIRDFYVLKGRITENGFAAVRVNEDHWNIDFCPMGGPELTVAADGQWFCAFMSRKKMHWAVADSGGSAFRLHVPTPANEDNEVYPTAVANRRGDVLLVWQVGPMAVKGNATVQWARFDKAGTPTGERGVVDKSFAGTKATAFVGTDDNLYVVTTATEAGEQP